MHQDPGTPGVFGILISMKSLEVSIVVVIALIAAGVIFVFYLPGGLLPEEPVVDGRDAYLCTGEVVLLASYNAEGTAVDIEGLGTFVQSENAPESQYENDAFVLLFGEGTLSVSNKESGVLLAECVLQTSGA